MQIGLKKNQQAGQARLKLFSSVHFLLLGTLAFAFVLAFVKVDDPDVWWHLKCGEMFLKDGLVPVKEIFSYTAAGSTWVDGYLPAQALLYIFWWLGGAAGLSIFSAVMIVAVYGLGLWISRGGRGYEAALLIAPLSVFIARGVMLPRPALLTPIFALLSLWLLEEHRQKGGKKIWLLAPLTALWANCHPGFPLGPILTGFYITGNVLRAIIGRNKAYFNPFILLIFSAQIAATLLNPYGYKIYYSALSLISHSELTELIVEWRPLFAKPAEIIGTIECYLAVCALGAMVFLWAWRRNRADFAIEHALIFAFLAAATAGARRNLILFSALSIPLIAWAVTGASKTRFESGRFIRLLDKTMSHLKMGLKPLVAVTVFLMIWFAATDRLYFYFNHFRSTGAGAQEGLFSSGAIEFVKEHRIKGRVFHTYSMGGYFLFNLYPQYRVYIDGRAYPYPLNIFREGELALQFNKAFEKIRARYDIRTVVLPLYPQKTWPLIMTLIKAENWAVVYADGTAIVFMGRGAGNDHIITDNELNLLSGPPSLETEGSAPGIFGGVRYAYGHIRWAKLYELMGMYGLAAQALEPATHYKPTTKNVVASFGSLLIQAGKLDEGIKIINKALDREPGNITALTGLADYYIAKKNYDKSEEILLRVLKLDPDHVKAWITLGEIAFNNHDFGGAAGRFRRALQINREDYETWEKLGMSLEFFDRRGAANAYNQALRNLKNSGGAAEDALRINGRLRNLKSVNQP